MASTIKPTLTRWTLTGFSLTPQGNGAFDDLTRTAYAAMAAAAWTRSADHASIPVHDYDRPVPVGDAYKACWGYDADERTEQAAVGAVCYSFKVPTGATGTLDGLAATILGDRYLDLGVDITLHVTSSETPPAWATVLAEETQRLSGVCATSGQAPTLPNKRDNVSADIAFPAEGASAVAVTAGQYVHVVIRLHDYLATRGAWIEGGAMLQVGSIEATFSADGVAEVVAEYPATYGVFSSALSTEVVGAPVPFATQRFVVSPFRFDKEAFWDTSTGNFAKMLAEMTRLPSAAYNTGVVSLNMRAFNGATVHSGLYQEDGAYKAMAIGATRSALTSYARVRAVKVASGAFSGVKCHVSVFGASDLGVTGCYMPSFDFTFQGKLFSIGYSALGKPDVYRGDATEIPLTSIISSGVDSVSNSDIYQQHEGGGIAVQPICTFETDGSSAATTIALAQPWQTGRIATLFIMVWPLGSNSLSSKTAINLNSISLIGG